MTMIINNLLCPTDFSDTANKAIRYAIDIALKYDATLHLVSVIDEVHRFDSFQVLAITPGDIYEQMLKITQEKLDELTSDIKSIVPRHTAVLEGHPATEIAKAAVDFDCDLIVIASHGRTGLEHILIGSVAESVTRHAHCPVFIVK